jgi:hypothetical protein
MIEIDVAKNKFCRTYIGGSKKKEAEIFIKVQGTKEDNSECDWLEYRKLLKTYLDDVILVLDSWRTTCRNESYVMLFIAMLYMKVPILFYGFIGLGVLLQIAYLILNQKQKNKVKAYSVCQSIILHEIKKTTGLNLDKI